MGYEFLTLTLHSLLVCAQSGICTGAILVEWIYYDAIRGSIMSKQSYRAPACDTQHTELPKGLGSEFLTLTLHPWLVCAHSGICTGAKLVEWIYDDAICGSIMSKQPYRAPACDTQHRPCYFRSPQG